MQVVELEKVNTSSVYCSGEGELYGHPKIYLEIDAKKGEVCCPYCSKLFKLKK